ncbi:uncharacterized protein [Musca autumnalis]|uniref:uncharacterized protein n=1 Tax=Musca autumnalis TaxID=221902 RepID=UPI003CF196C1
MSHQEGLKSNFNCNKCNEVDNDDMVQCDKCDKWYHFNCVGVNSSVSEVSWSCDGCNLNKETTSMEENQSVANTTGLLNVPQATSSPTNAGELLQMASKTTSGTGGRIPTASTTSTSVNRPTNTLFQGKAKDNRTNTVPSSLVPVNSSAITGTHLSTSNINQQKPVSSQQNNNVTLQVDLQLKMLEEQQRMQQEFLERKYQILSQCSQQEQTHQNSFNMTSNWNIFSGPTPSQLAARHSIPRDLPHFHGDPEEWPLFISSFENSTAVAGYSHAENLIRLQSCLKDNWKLAVPLKIREGLWNQPIATKTRLGWTIQGPNDCYRQGSWLNIHHCDCEEKYNELHQMVKENFNLEDSSVKTVVSAQDSRSMNILKTSCQKVDGRYEVGLLWKYNVKQLPESYNNARKRLTCLQKKFQKDKNLRDVLQEQINNLLKKGYARKLSDEEISNNGNPVWYLPTFITLNPNKPGKIRMVWDGAAKSNGVCLNDFIHCGPDLLKSLVDILLSFRVGKIAICGDIAEMFHRINVRKEDMHAQRFLWCDENDNPEKPSIYVMRALTFGICCAPCIAHYVRDFNAEQFKNEFPRAVEAIQQYHYVDDFIDSVNDDEQAIELASQVQYIHSAGGFHIRNWASNSNAVISHLQDDSSKDQNPRDLAETEKVLDDEGILRARGRVLYLNHQDTIILPTMHHVTVLLVRYVHENFHHISHETVINNIKSQYYIPKLRVLYKSIRRSCQHCKNLSANPVMPQMSTLPKARLASFERPFTYVGIDYFGPLYVTVGRRKEKRWGVLFTCLTVRAVHIEIAYSLDTSSCVMCINNFIARRGIPNEIYTDNGTNFKATAKIFSPESKAFDLKDMASMLDHIKWKFNPPAAPHMGGAWERLVRSVKTTLYNICPNANFNDETLRNAMAEAEFIINSRPLTFVSLESCDDEALTPNHLLLGSSSGYKPIVTELADLRLRWRQTQQFSDQFWRRWVKEYMPTLTRRGKWFQKTKPLKVGDIVIIIDENLPRHCWPKGKIVNTIIAKDGQVRQATVRTQHGVFQRPTAKLAKLDVGIIDQ